MNSAIQKFLNGMSDRDKWSRWSFKADGNSYQYETPIHGLFYILVIDTKNFKRIAKFKVKHKLDIDIGGGRSAI